MGSGAPVSQSADIIYDFYGLAFFVLGVAIAARAAPLASSIVKRRILALAVFGLVHGVYEWLHLSEFAVLSWNTPLTRHGLSVTSFLFLLYFAVGGRGRITAIFAGIAALAVTGWITNVLTADTLVAVEAATRWGFAVPVAIAAGLAFLLDSGLRGPDQSATRFSRLSAGVMFVYAGLQLFVAPADFFPASVLNTSAAEAATGVSVLVMRGVCALALTGSVLLLLNSFDEAIRQAAFTAAESAEEQLRLNKLMLATVFDAAPVGLVIANLKTGEVLEANRAMWDMVGYAPEDLDGQRMRAITPEDFHGRDDEALEKLNKFGRLQSYEKEYIHKDGYRVPVRVEAAVLHSERGEERLLSVIQDVSDQKAAEDRLRRQQALSEQANVAKSQFMANMSHELRTPLNGVLGMLELASRQPLDEKAGQYVRIAKSSGQMLLKLVEDLLDFETLSSGRATLVEEPFTLSALYEKAIAPLASEAEQKSLEFEYVSTAEDAYVGDLNRIAQVISNVVGNAVKFTETGRISVCLSKEPDGTGVRVEVRDTGIGMPDDFIAQAFDRFTQGDGSATRDHEGAGLGLAICKGLIDTMGGEISLTSDLGVGTTVTICLPLKTPSEKRKAQAIEAPADATSAGTRQPARILVAEDNAMNRQTLAAMLDDQRFELVFVEDGAEALACLHEQAFDLMILDIQMPGKSGDEVLAEIRRVQQASSHTPTPAIACTANAYADQREHYRAVGFDSIITKPIDLDRLEAEVARLLAA